MVEVPSLAVVTAPVGDTAMVSSFSRSNVSTVSPLPSAVTMSVAVLIVLPFFMMRNERPAVVVAGQDGPRESI